MDWTATAVFVTMGIFVAKIIWDIISYFLKKKDKFTDNDHEEIHAIKQSLIEIRGITTEIISDIKSMRQGVNDIDGRTEESEKKIRNIQEALRGIRAVHNRVEPDNKIDFNGLLGDK